MSVTKFPENVLINGTLTVSGALSLTTGITNSDVGATAAIAATKLQHQHHISYHQVDGSAVVAAIAPVYTCRGATATVVGFEVACIDAPSGGDLKFTVDLYKFDADTPTPATILTGVVDYVNATPDGTVLAGTIDTAALVVGDSVAVIVAVAGSTGTQGQGMVATITVREDAE